MLTVPTILVLATNRDRAQDANRNTEHPNRIQPVVCTWPASDGSHNPLGTLTDCATGKPLFYRDGAFYTHPVPADKPEN